MAAFQKRKTEWTLRNKSLSNNRCLSISKLKILKNNITNGKLKEKKNVVIVITSITTVLSFLPAKVIPDGALSAFRKMFVESTASFDAFQVPI